MTQAARIAGCGVVCAAGRGVDPFWDAMLAAKPGQRAESLGDHRLEDAQFAAISAPRMCQDEDLGTTWLSMACHDALTQAAPYLEALPQRRTALLAGSSLGGMTIFEATHRRWWDGEARAGPGLSVPPLSLERALYDGPTRHVGQMLDVDAGAWTLNTACSSATNALGLARLWLRYRRIDVALVAGFDVISPFVFAGFRCLNAMDYRQPCVPFGAERRGLNLGDAGVALVLVRADEAAGARWDRPVDLVGYGSSCDAHHLTRPDLEGHGAARAMRAALHDAEVGPEQVGLLSAHGTATPFNDTMESRAFEQIFTDKRPMVHCAKPVTGHTLGAAGAVDALAVWCAMREGIVPPTYRRGPPDAELRFQPLESPQALPERSVGLSTSSGFGGSNAALVFKRGDACQ